MYHKLLTIEPARLKKIFDIVREGGQFSAPSLSLEVGWEVSEEVLQELIEFLVAECDYSAKVHTVH